MNESQPSKEAAIRFLQLAAAGRVDEAFTLVAPGFRHHNPYFAGTASALQAGMRENAHQNPDKSFEVQRALADGPLVAVHSRVHMPRTGMTLSVVHLFRFEGEQIVELWDVGQPQPADMINPEGMF
ncbi:MAG: nuclear transport factor 2 family protein [Acidobacteriota bacterium]